MRGRTKMVKLPKCCAFLLVLVVLFAAYAQDEDLSFNVYRQALEKSEFAIELSDQAIKDLVTDALYLEHDKCLYSIIDVHVYAGYYVAILFSRSNYRSYTYRLDPNREGTFAITEDYAGNEALAGYEGVCPDQDAEIILSFCFSNANHVSRREGKKTYDNLVAAGIQNVVHLKGQQEATPKAIKDYLACESVKYWGRIGHGSRTSISFSGSRGGSISHTEFGNMDLTHKFLILNSCQFHNPTTVASIIDKANGYILASGDEVNLQMNASEYAFRDITTFGITEDREFGKLIEEESQEHCSPRNQYGYTRNKETSETFWKAVIKDYVAVSFPGEGAELEQNSKYMIKWGSNVEGNVKVELLKAGSVIKELAASGPQSGEVELNVDNSFKVGNDYAIKVTHLKDPQLVDERKFSIVKENICITYPYTEDFEQFQEGEEFTRYWEQLDGDDINWIVITGATPSQQYGTTGAAGDHTSGSGKYIYIEASNPNNPNKKADFISQKFDFRGLADPKLTFYYHMFSDSQTMGDLFLDIEVDGSWKEGVVKLTDDDYGDKWNEQVVDLTPYKGERVRFRFRGVTGTSYASDICFDDFKITGTPTGISNYDQQKQKFSLQYQGSQIIYHVPENVTAPVTLSLYSMQGRLIQTLINKPHTAGFHSIKLMSSPNNRLAAGIYTCRLQVKKLHQTLNIIVH